MLKIEELFGAAEKLRYSLGMLGISLLYKPLTTTTAPIEPYQQEGTRLK